MFNTRLFSTFWRRLPVALLVAISAWRAGAAADPGARSYHGETYARARQAQQRHSDRLLSLNSVVGAATGLAREGGFAIKVYAKDRNVAAVPRRLDGVPVEVEAVGEVFALRRPPPRRSRRLPRDNPPTVRIDVPADGDVVTGVVKVVASGSDDRGIVTMEFFVDNASIGLDGNANNGWSVGWNTALFADGDHQLSATATDTAGNRGFDRITVFLDNLPGPFANRPAPIGVSTGNANECAAGTIGCRVTDSQGNVYALSNNHVFARENWADLGETIVQPGLYDTDCKLLYTNQAIGILADYFPIDFRRRGNNLIDAAIALCPSGDLAAATPAGGYGLPGATPVAAQIDQAVQKYGRTTLLTHGYVSGVEATITVTYETGAARFTHQIIVSSAPGFILPGDSGSLLVEDNTACGAVGLLFAGTADGSLAVANPIGTVLDAFDVTIDGR